MAQQAAFSARYMLGKNNFHCFLFRKGLNRVPFCSSYFVSYCRTNTYGCCSRRQATHHSKWLRFPQFSCSKNMGFITVCSDLEGKSL